MARILPVFLVGLCIGLVAITALPHNKYFRFQEHRLLNARKADWIYERLTFDETPVDVAFIGTSRTAGGISGPLIEHAYCQATGRNIRVVNLGMPQTGRDMDYLIAKELLQTKQPKLLMLQVTEIEGRKPHPGFLQLADASDILTAPLLINFNWPKNIASLPGRQMSLFKTTQLNRPALRQKFDSEEYFGIDMDRTEGIVLIDGSFKSRDVSLSEEKLDKAYKRRKAAFSRTYILPKPLQFLEYRLSRVYLERIFDMAQTNGAEIAFNYMPAYRFDVPVPDHILELTKGANVYNLNEEIIDDFTMWLDPNHPNTTGSRIASLKAAAYMAVDFPTLGTPGTCDPSALD